MHTYLYTPAQQYRGQTDRQTPPFTAHPLATSVWAVQSCRSRPICPKRWWENRQGRHTCTCAQSQSRQRWKLGSEKKKSGCKIEKSRKKVEEGGGWELACGWSVQRCPELQDVVIRKLGEKVCENGEGEINPSRGGGERMCVPLRRNAWVYLRVWRADTPLPAQRVDGSSSLWALLLCRAAQGLTQPARQERQGRVRRIDRRQTCWGPGAVKSFHQPGQQETPEREGDEGEEGEKKEHQCKQGGKRERQGEGGEGRKEREGGRRLKHEEGRLTDIAALAISSDINTGWNTSSLPELRSAAALSLDPRPPSSFYSKREDRGDREESEKRTKKRRSGGRQ